MKLILNFLNIKNKIKIDIDVMVKFAILPQYKNNSGLKYIFDLISVKLVFELNKNSLIKIDFKIIIKFNNGAYNGFMPVSK